MAEYQDREHFIPLRYADLVRALVDESSLPRDRAEGLGQLARLLEAIVHFEYHARLNDLKDDYAPFDPDCVTASLVAVDPGEREARLENLFAKLDSLMERANFKKLGAETIEEATRQASTLGLNMAVDFTIFEKLAGYARGLVMGRATKRHWLFFWRRVEVRLPVYQRLALFVKMKKSKRVHADVNTGAVYLKLFKEIPQVDVEMLLPGARLRMPGFTQIKMGGSWIGGLAYIFYSLGTEVFEALARGVWYVFWGPLVALVGYGYKQWYGYQSTKTSFGLRLTQSLYYQNLDNNAGVLYHLLGEAEEQECKEALLAYYMMWRFPRPEGWTVADLDDAIEQELERLAKVKVDFEIEDAVAKLQRLGLVESQGDRLKARPLPQVLVALDQIWDNYFSFPAPNLNVRSA